MRPAFCFLLAALCAAPAFAQAPPGTDIWLIAWNALGTPDAAVNITARAGYDNQPHFAPDGGLLFTAGHGEQTDIYRYDPATGRTTQVTDTPESEYSATPMPGDSTFSVIRVEADGTQRLWAFANDGRRPRLVLENVKPVGYHAWADDHTLALFVLGDPATLQRADARTGLADTLVYGIGRSLHPVQGGVSFVHKREAEVWVITTLALSDGALTPFAPTRPGREDYAWYPNDGPLLMADGAVLYHWHPDLRVWEPRADFTALGVTDITRLAISPDGKYVAFVASE